MTVTRTASGGLTEDLGTFHARAKEWVTANLEPLDGADPYLGHATDDADHVVRAKAIQRKLFDAGFAGLCYPVEYGGRGLPAEYQDAFIDVTYGYELPRLFNMPTFTIILPTILDFGTEEQKKRFIPAALKGEELWVQFLSEPTGGSDLAGALTRADRRGDVFVLNGSKIWSTFAWKSDYALCVARTDWDVPKHKGLSVLIVKVHQPGITITQIKHVDGTDDFCQEFFDDVAVPADQVLGQVDDGWNVASRLLLHEREAMSGSSPYAMAPRTAAHENDQVRRRGTRARLRRRDRRPSAAADRGSAGADARAYRARRAHRHVHPHRPSPGRGRIDPSAVQRDDAGQAGQHCAGDRRRSRGRLE